MIRTQIYFPDDLHKELILLAKFKGVNFSTVVRAGAKEIIKKRKNMRSDKWKDFVGALTYGPKDLSNHINDIYK